MLKLRHPHAHKVFIYMFSLADCMLDLGRKIIKVKYDKINS